MKKIKNPLRFISNLGKLITESDIELETEFGKFKKNRQNQISLQYKDLDRKIHISNQILDSESGDKE